MKCVSIHHDLIKDSYYNQSDSVDMSRLRLSHINHQASHCVFLLFCTWISAHSQRSAHFFLFSIISVVCVVSGEILNIIQHSLDFPVRRGLIVLNVCCLKKTPTSAVPTAPSNGEVAAVQSRICKRSLRTFPWEQSYKDLPRPQNCFCYFVCVCPGDCRCPDPWLGCIMEDTGYVLN